MCIGFNPKRHMRDAGRLYADFFGTNVSIESGRMPGKICKYIQKDGDFAYIGELPIFEEGIIVRTVKALKSGKRLADIALEDGNEYVLASIKRWKDVSEYIRVNSIRPVTTPNCKGIWIHGSSGTGKDHIIRLSC